jgi:hypothetical protein
MKAVLAYDLQGDFGLKRQHFIAPSAGGFKQRLRGIEFEPEMIYNESNKAVSSTALFVVFGDVGSVQPRGQSVHVTLSECEGSPVDLS